jgi:hypothetical protein
MITRREGLEKACDVLRNLAAVHRGNAVPVLVDGEQQLDTNSLPDCIRLPPPTTWRAMKIRLAA